MGSYELRLDPSPRRALNRLPLPAALAVAEFMTGRLLENPQRAGGELERELSGYRSARVRDYRVIYRVFEAEAVVHVVRIEHRKNVYRRR